MGIYRMKLAGRTAPLLVKADGVREAKDRVVTECVSLSADEMEAALTDGATVWRPGEAFPADEAEPDEAGAEE